MALEKEAKELLKKAKGLTVPSILELRIKPDWEAAAPLLDKAALMYKVRSVGARNAATFASVFGRHPSCLVPAPTHSKRATWKRLWKRTSGRPTHRSD